jgi:hypothetical protein
MMKNLRNLALGTAFLFMLRLVAAASPCDPKNIPRQIQASLYADYAGWRIVTPSALEASDRETWLEDYSKECPGIIKGKFTDVDEGYVFNLIQKRGGKTFQQVVYFQHHDDGYITQVLLKPQAISIVLVIRLFAPGRYKDVTNGKSLMIATDTIGLSQIGSGTVVYYWDGTIFRRIVTSE